MPVRAVISASALGPPRVRVMNDMMTGRDRIQSMILNFRPARMALAISSELQNS